jgi:6-pyruvoyltetrahydropterin/6-carboxytetrahydropterin synthase
MSHTFEITKAATFDAAHHLNVGADDNPYRRMHGHSFRVEATVAGEMIPGEDWVGDLGELEIALKSVAHELDHGLLNEKPGLQNPTLERLCLYFRDRLVGRYPGLSRIEVSRPTIGERCSLSL